MKSNTTSKKVEVGKGNEMKAAKEIERAIAKYRNTKNIDLKIEIKSGVKIDLEVLIRIGYI